MNKKEIKKLIVMNKELLVLLGFASSLMDISQNHESICEDNNMMKKIKWFLKNVENVVYHDKPIDKTP